LGRGGRDIGRTLVEVETKTFQAVLGAMGSIGGSWEYSAYYTYGRSVNTEARPENRITSRFNAALNAVDDPSTQGVVDPVCAINIDANPANDDPGCRPINLFGENRFSAESAAYVLGRSLTQSMMNQHVLQGTIRGTPFFTWAGPVSIATGVEYRRLDLDVTSDATSAIRGYSNGGVVPYSGEVSVKEAFTEVQIPLAHDQSWAKRLSVNLAGRITDYSTSGQVETSKVGIDYTINDALRFRATRSRDIRAPSLSELFAKGGTTQLTVTDGMLGSYLVTAANAGNPLLTPENANTFTAGVVFTPGFLPRFRASIDYYDIDLGDAIISLTPATIVDRCLSRASPQLCQFIVRDANSTPSPNMIVQVNNFPANLQSVKTSGIDFEAQYSFPLNNGGEVRLQGLATYIINSSINDGVKTLRLDGSVEQPSVAAIGGSPKWRFNFNSTYKADWGRLSATARYIGPAKISRSYTPLDMSESNNSVSGRFYADISTEIYLINSGDDRRVSIFGVINNVLNNFPPITGTGGFGTSRAIYDTIGRTYSVGVRFKM